MPESEPQDAARSPATQANHRNPFRLASRTLLEYLLLAALVGLFVWRALIPAWSSLNTDFPNYYLAARLYRQGYPMDRVYDWTWFQRQWDHTGFERRVVAYIPITLFSSLPVLPLTSLPPLEAKRCWLVVNLILLGLAALLLTRLTALGWRRILILIFLATFPLRTNFLFGQQHLMVLVLLTVAAWLYLKGWSGSSGGILAIAASFKLYPALFVFYFLRKRQWRALAGLALTGAALAGLSLLLFGYEAHRVYVVDVLSRVMRGENLDCYNVGFNSVSALLRRLFIEEPQLNPHPLVHWPAAYAFLQPLYQALLLVPFLWWTTSHRAEPAREGLEWGCYIALLLMLSPNPASYHYCALILTAALTARYLLARGLETRAALFAALYGLASLSYYRLMLPAPSGWAIFLGFPRLYALLAFTAFLLWLLASSSPHSGAVNFRNREAAAFSLIFLVIVTAGTWSNLRHFRGQFENYDSRVVDTGSQMALQPAIAGETVLFTTLQADDYAIGRLTGGSLTRMDFGSDTFHPALLSNLGMGCVELASARSRIVRFPLDGPPPPVNQLPVEVEDGEQPAVSPDGRWLLFIREHQGRGSLWIKDLRPMETTAPSMVERRLAGDEFNVVDATFSPDSRGVLFSAQRGAQPELFGVPAEGNPRVHTAAPDWPATRYPAFSPDGAWFAFSWYQRGTWQLCVTKMGSGTVRQLTHGECNSITPAWLPDSKTLIYATDCGRGLGMTTLARARVIPGGHREESEQPR